MILKEIKEAQDIFIVGCCLSGENNFTGDFMITDDEHEFVVTINNRIKHRITSNGFVNVMTKAEFNKNKEYFSEEIIDNDFLLLPNFVGEIGVKVVFRMKGEDNIHVSELDLDEYLMHQDGFSCEDGLFEKENCSGAEYCVTLPTDTEILLGRYDEDRDVWETQQWIEM